MKGRKEGGRKRESVEGKDGQVGRKSEGREVDQHQAQVLQSQELLLRRKGSREDQQPMEKEEKELMVKEEELKEDKGKTKKWTWSEVNLGGNSQQQEEPSLLAILRFFSFLLQSLQSSKKEMLMIKS